MVATEDPISNDLHECAVFRSIGKCAVRNLDILLKKVMIRFGAG
jgi:hypothetical protein